MSDSFDNWKRCYKIMTPIDQVLAWIVRVIYLTSMLLVLLFLCIWRRSATQKHVYLQLALEITNLIALIYAIFLQDFKDPPVRLRTILFNVSFFTYLLGHWVFVV